MSKLTAWCPSWLGELALAFFLLLKCLFASPFLLCLSLSLSLFVICPLFVLPSAQLLSPWRSSLSSLSNLSLPSFLSLTSCSLKMSCSSWGFSFFLPLEELLLLPSEDVSESLEELSASLLSLSSFSAFCAAAVAFVPFLSSSLSSPASLWAFSLSASILTVLHSPTRPPRPS